MLPCNPDVSSVACRENELSVHIDEPTYLGLNLKTSPWRNMSVLYSHPYTRVPLDGGPSTTFSSVLTCADGITPLFLVLYLSNVLAKEVRCFCPPSSGWVG